MKQTAVEWLETQIVKFHNWKLNPIYDENCFDEIELDKSIKQAKEIEKRQRQKTIEEVFEWLTKNNYVTDLKENLIEQFEN